jgi:hypothetical protein
LPEPVSSGRERAFEGGGRPQVTMTLPQVRGQNRAIRSSSQGAGLIGSVLSLGDPVEDRFDVEDGGAVNRFEVADPESQAVDGQDLDPVEADRVGPVG